MTPPSDIAATAAEPASGGVTGASRPRARSFWRKLAAAAGPGYLVAVGYMDPGNWATGLAGGSLFGYRLLSVMILANLMAMVLQSLAARLGIASGMDLAQACRARWGPLVRIPLWLLCEIAIIACDLAEVLGCAIALQLLFHIPLPIGVGLSSVGVLAVLALQRRGAARLETLVVVLIGLIGLCLGLELWFSQPSWPAVASGLVPRRALLTDPAMLYIGMGIIGATVMPHNLYLHSSLAQQRPYPRTVRGRGEAIRFARIDSTIALGLALLINAAILILAGSTFHHPGRTEAVGIEDAYRLLTPMVGVGGASLLFGVALLAASQNATITGALAGQIVLEGFTSLRMSPWIRRLLSRLVAIVPAAVIASLYGADGVGRLLIGSQVVLSLQLPFAVIPLILITSDRGVMGAHVISARQRGLCWAIAGVLVVLNGALLVMTFGPH